MATGLSRSLEGGHDMIYDFCCTTCAGQKLNAEALFYCKDCRKLLCEECKKYHAKFFEGHRVLGREEVALWEDVKPVTSSLMCDEHPGKELEMFCEDHGRVCCHACISVKHRSCKEIKPVSEVSKGIQKKSEFKLLLTEATTTKSRLKSLHDKQENNIKMLQKARGEITSTFKNVRKKFNQIVDRLEEQSTTELDRILAMMKEQVTIDKDACSYFIDKIQKLLNDIQTLGKQSEELAFQCYMKCSEQMASADKLLSSMQNVDFQVKFIPDSNFERYLSSLDTLGTVTVKSTAPFDSFKYKDFAPQPTPPPDHIYSVEKKQSYNVKTGGDTDTCYISGICQLLDGQTAIVDGNNTKVKLLRAFTYHVLDELKLPPVPRDICSTTGTELAVTVCKDKNFKFIRKEIQFINAVDGKLSHTRTVQLDHECFGIFFHSAQLYVGSMTSVYVYNLLGIKVKKIYEDKEDSSQRRCYLSDDGSKMYITNTPKDLLLTLDSSGHKLSSFSDSELLYPASVCVADNGSVFVGGWTSDTVLQVDREGKKKMTTLARKDDGIYSSQSLCYNRRTRVLLVGHNSDNLLALHLK